jgi:hypothetical protein
LDGLSGRRQPQVSQPLEQFNRHILGKIEIAGEWRQLCPKL